MAAQPTTTTLPGTHTSGDASTNIHGGRRGPRSRNDDLVARFSSMKIDSRFESAHNNSAKPMPMSANGYISSVLAPLIGGAIGAMPTLPSGPYNSDLEQYFEVAQELEDGKTVRTFSPHRAASQVEINSICTDADPQLRPRSIQIVRVTLDHGYAGVPDPPWTTAGASIVEQYTKQEGAELGGVSRTQYLSNTVRDRDVLGMLAARGSEVINGYMEVQMPLRLALICRSWSDWKRLSSDIALYDLCPDATTAGDVIPVSDWIRPNPAAAGYTRLTIKARVMTLYDYLNMATLQVRPAWWDKSAVVPMEMEQAAVPGVMLYLASSVSTTFWQGLAEFEQTFASNTTVADPNVPGHDSVGKIIFSPRSERVVVDGPSEILIVMSRMDVSRTQPNADYAFNTAAGAVGIPIMRHNVAGDWLRPPADITAALLRGIHGATLLSPQPRPLPITDIQIAWRMMRNNVCTGEAINDAMAIFSDLVHRVRLPDGTLFKAHEENWKPWMTSFAAFQEYTNPIAPDDNHALRLVVDPALGDDPTAAPPTTERTDRIAEVANILDKWRARWVPPNGRPHGRMVYSFPAVPVFGYDAPYLRAYTLFPAGYAPAAHPTARLMRIQGWFDAPHISYDCEDWFNVSQNTRQCAVNLTAAHGLMHLQSGYTWPAIAGITETELPADRMRSALLEVSGMGRIASWVRLTRTEVLSQFNAMVYHAGAAPTETVLRRAFSRWTYSHCPPFAIIVFLQQTGGVVPEAKADRLRQFRVGGASEEEPEVVTGVRVGELGQWPVLLAYSRAYASDTSDESPSWIKHPLYSKAIPFGPHRPSEIAFLRTTRLAEIAYATEQGAGGVAPVQSGDPELAGWSLLECALPVLNTSMITSVEDDISIYMPNKGRTPYAYGWPSIGESRVDFSAADWAPIYEAINRVFPLPAGVGALWTSSRTEVQPAAPPTKPPEIQKQAEKVGEMMEEEQQ